MNEEDKDKPLNAINSLFWAYFFIVIFLVIIAPISVYWFAHDRNWCTDPSTSGTLGDTIGGATAPIIGLFSAVLIYFSFSAQVRANELTRKAVNDAKEDSNFKYLNEEFEKLKAQVADFQNNLPDSSSKGINALLEFSNKVPSYWINGENYGYNSSKAMLKALYFFKSIEDMLADSQKLKIGKEFSKILRTKMNQYYLVNLKTPLSKIEKWNVTKEFLTGNEIEKISFEINTSASNIIGFFNLTDVI